MTVSDHLLRGYAPIPTTAWQAIDAEARERLTPLLAARRLTDWSGPHGWQEDRLSIGRVADIDGPAGGPSAADVRTVQRRVLAYAEIKIPFTVSRREVEDIQRGAGDADLDDLDRAVHVAAIMENRAVFHGWTAADITGMADYSAYPPVGLGDDCATYPTVVAQAVDRMRERGIGGPYALAISPERYTRIVETTEHGGYLLLDHLIRVLSGGEVVWAPGLEGALVLSQRGGDFQLAVGQDWSIGYTAHDAETLQLYLEESFTFWPTERDAILVMTEGLS